MKAIFLFCALAVFCVCATGQVQGPLSATNFSILTIPGSSATWTNINNAGGSDDNYASFGNLSGSKGVYTDYLVATGFNFSIPSATTITGIVVEVEESDPNLLTSEYSVRLIKAFGTSGLGGTEKASGIPYPATDAYHAYGTSEDLWGDSWTYKDIDNNNFGVAVAAQRNANGGITAGRIDDIRITIYYTFMILPVNLISFSAVKSNSAVHLNWTTAMETNMNHYDLERSADGSSFSSLSSITARNLSSNSNYSYTDNSPLKTVSYYRLKLVGNTGTAKYSDIISVHFNGANTIDLYPSPISQGETLYITNDDKEQLTIQFFDVAGKTLSSVQTSSNQVPLSWSEHTKGIIFYRITNKNNEALGTGKLVIK